MTANALNSGLSTPSSGHDSTRDGNLSEVDGEREVKSVEGEEQAKRRVVSIYHNYGYLKEILERYEEVIRQRWSKKKRGQRRKLLQKAWPNISESHRPDILASIGETDEQRKRGTAHREAYMWPSINLEDLFRDYCILNFLNSRGRHSPATFATVDLHSVQTGFHMKTIKQSRTPEVSKWTMDLTSEFPGQYGQIFECELQIKEARRDELPSVSDGLLVLEIQDKILDFLVNLSGCILHGKQLDDAFKSVPVALEPAVLPLDYGELPSALDFALEKPYLVPQKITMERLQSFAETCLQDWRDHALKLREDPAYFSKVYREWAEHCSEQILDYDRRPSPELSNLEEHEKFWNRAALRTINEAYEHLFTWRTIVNQIDIMEQLHQDTAFQRPEDNPKYLEAVTRLKIFQEARGIELSGRELLRRFPASSAYRALFYREYGLDGSLRLRNDVDEDDRLLWLISRIASNQKDIPQETLAAELGWLARFDKKRKKQISAIVGSCIDHFNTHCELRAQLQVLCPQAYSTDDKPLEERHRREALYKEWYESQIHPLLEHVGINEPSSSELKLFGARIRDARMWEYPLDEKRTKNRTAIMKRAEKDLDTVWEKFDKRMRQGVTPSTYEILYADMPQHSQLQRTADWVRPHGSNGGNRKLHTCLFPW